MKKLLILFTCFSIISSCSNKVTHNSSFKDDVETKCILTQPLRIDEIKINTSIPFGCSNLTSKHWEADPENYGRLKQPGEKEFREIGACYARINKVSSQLLAPKTPEAKHIKIGVDFTNTVFYDTIAQRNIDSLKYRLPNIGRYQCYYYFGQSKKMFGDYGVLLLFDPKRNIAKTINVYYEVGGDQHVNLRYFYLEDATIRIYEGSCYDNGCGLTEKFKVNIRANGQININELN